VKTGFSQGAEEHCAARSLLNSSQAPQTKQTSNRCAFKYGVGNSALNENGDQEMKKGSRWEIRLFEELATSLRILAEPEPFPPAFMSGGRFFAHRFSSIGKMMHLNLEWDSSRFNRDETNKTPIETQLRQNKRFESY
jgi:hypothetical protein